MNTTYSKMVFDRSQPDTITATKLNLLRDDLSLAIAAGGGGTGTGDMTKAIYDSNNNGKVDTCDSVPWGSVTGTPTFGDMTKAVYDANSDNIVDHAALSDAAPWTGITGKPSTFPPDSTAMLKSVYDTNSNNKVDNAENADSTPWTGITGRPSTFTPATHAPTHLDNGTDPVPVATTSRTGLAPILSGSATTYLNGNGTWTTPAGTSSFDPGTWTNITLATGWTVKTQPQYRIENSTGLPIVICRGSMTQASGAAALAFTGPAAIRPPATRMVVISGMQTEGQTLGHVQVATTGDVTVTPMVRAVFTWPVTSTAQDWYLDSLTFSL